jgi:competence protein ComEC
VGARIAFAPALALWAGTLAGLSRADLWGSAAALAAAAAAAVAITVARGRGRWFLAALLALCAAAGAMRGAQHARALAVQRSLIESGPGLHRLEAVVRGPGARGGERVEVEVRAARPPLARGTRLTLEMPDGRRAGWGDRIAGLAAVEVAPGRRNPGGFDARAADFARGVAGRGRIHSIAAHDSSGPAGWSRATVVRWRREIERTLEARLDSVALAYAIPLMVGDRSGLEPVQRARIRDAGLAHLLALSGLHVTWLALLARGAVAVAGGGPVPRALAGALSALVYLGLAGWLPSLARAAATEGFGAAARATQRALDPLQALSLAVMVLLALAPGWALDLGFQLSCAATFGLVLALERGGGARPGWRRRLLDPLRATAAAQLAAAPLLAAAFHGLSWSVWLANLPAVPLAGLLLGLLWVAVLLDALLPGAAAPLFAASSLCARGLDAIAAAGAGLPFAFVPCGPLEAFLPLAAAGAALLAAARLVPAESHARAAGPAARRAGALGAALIATATLLSFVPAPRVPPAGRVWIVALDVGQGDAIALGFPHGWWLVDAGPRGPWHDAGESVAVPFFRWAGVRALDALLVTHMDADHAGGAAAVWRALRPVRVMSPDSAAAALRPRGRAPLERVAAGETLLARPRVTVLWPPHEADGRSRNERSLVLLIDLAGRRVLLTADADSTVEARLAVAPGVELLKTGHHGARSSSGVLFLSRAAPREAVVSAGRRNPFGHPHEETLARLVAAGARVRRTDLEGAVWYELSASGLEDVDWRRRAPRSLAGEAMPARDGPGAAPLPARHPRRRGDPVRRRGSGAQGPGVVARCGRCGRELRRQARRRASGRAMLRAANAPF